MVTLLPTTLLLCFYIVNKEIISLIPLHIGEIIPVVKYLPSCSNYLSTIPFLNIITLEIMLSNYEFLGWHIYSMDNSNVLSQFSLQIVSLFICDDQKYMDMSSFHSTNAAALLISAFREEFTAFLILFPGTWLLSVDSSAYITQIKIWLMWFSLKWYHMQEKHFKSQKKLTNSKI